ncbi:MAG: hypothetical protein WD431_06970 [Cyclobacteriaceae bacterium]
MTTTRRDILKITGLTLAGGMIPVSTFSSVLFEKAPISFHPIKSAFNPKTAEWDIEWPGRVSQHDVVYLSPPIDPMQGIPLGNGDMGILFWCEGSKIIAAVNKSDLWEDASFEKFQNWSKEEEDYSTTLRHACRIIIDFKFPVFDTLYLSDFNARINLADGSLTLHAASPFGKVGLDAFVDHETGFLCYDLSCDFEENIPVEIAIERFGSRTFSHWYSRINRDASIGSSGTEVMSDLQGGYITQKLSGSSFAVGGSVLNHNNLEVSYGREHSRRALIELKSDTNKEAQIAFLVTSPDTGNPLPQVKEGLSDLRKNGMDHYKRANEAAWKTLWHRSLMDYGDDYLNNLWYLTMYYAHASQGGNYPGRFNNGLWAWNRDVQNWNFYFHWNQQQLYWPLNAAGFHELVAPYLDYRYRSLEQAKEDAWEHFHTEGAYISDVTERRGFNSINELHNHTPVAEIALDFWRQYQYTGDKNFLKEKALPFILEASRFFESLFILEDDGMYHAKEGSGYEGWIIMKDVLTEVVYGKGLFSVALEALKEAKISIPEAKKWRKILEHLVALPFVKADDSAIVAQGASYKLERGYFKGKLVPSNEVLSAGWGIKENKWLTTYFPKDDEKYGMKVLDGIFPTVPSSPVFPSGLVGLSQEDSELFKKVKTTALLYTPEQTGWDPTPIVMARLGLSEELAILLENFPKRWQIYVNGWGHWGMEGEINKDAEWFFRTNSVTCTTSDERFPFPMWPFRHMSMESMSVLATAMNESLLQSYDGVVRIAPAFSSEKSGRFTLHAAGGFIVSSETLSGTVQWICIKSTLGNTCRVKIPWEKAKIYSGLKEIKYTKSGDITEIKTKTGDILMMVPEEKEIDNWVVEQEKPRRNESVKYHSSGEAQLGLPRMF